MRVGGVQKVCLIASILQVKYEARSNAMCKDVGVKLGDGLSYLTKGLKWSGHWKERLFEGNKKLISHVQDQSEIRIRVFIVPPIHIHGDLHSDLGIVNEMSWVKVGD